MKKAIIFGMAVWVAGMATAQEGVVMVGQMGGSNGSEAKVTAEAALVSSQVWRGQVRNNDFVFQPQATIEQYGVSFNVWANYDLGNSWNGTSSDFSEIDLSLAYTLPLDYDQITFDLGVINYNYMGNGSAGTVIPSTTELFARATVQSWRQYVIPSVTFFGDIDEADGVYVLFDIVAPYQVSDYLQVAGGISAGWGDSSYNDYYWGENQDKGFNDYNFYGNASYEIMENLTAAVNLTYTLLEGGSIRSAGKTIYEKGEKFYGGVSIAYDF